MKLSRRALILCSVLTTVLTASHTRAAVPEFGCRPGPLWFEANDGQLDSRVRFVSRTPGGTLFLMPTAAVVALRPAAAGPVFRLQLLGANPRATVTGVDELPGKANYYRGADPAQWQVDVPTFARVQYRDIYRGVDLVYYGNERLLEYDFVVAPGTDPRTIRLAVTGADRVRLDPRGDLVLEAGRNALRLAKPVVYQETDQGRQEIDGRYVLRAGGRQIGFAVGPYDRQRPLVIDPTLVYSTYLGGSQKEKNRGLWPDTAGNIYVWGQTESVNFPTKNAAQSTAGGPTDLFVTKYNASGVVQYSTYVGGSGDEEGTGSVDGLGNVFLVGTTTSTDFPTHAAYQGAYGGSNDVFAVKLNASGQIVYATYLGGSDKEEAFADVDTNGNLYVSGETSSANFPTQNAFQSTYGGGSEDLFVTKFNPTGGIVYSTYLGGSDSETGTTRVDDSGNAFVIGETSSSDFPVRNPAQAISGGGDHDVFITKLPPTGGQAVFSTFFGGNGDDVETTDYLDDAGNLYLTGRTTSEDLPTKNAAQNTYGGGGVIPSLQGDAFFAKYNSAGALQFATYLGGNGYESGSLVADTAGHLIVYGPTTSTDFPTLNAVQPTYGGPAVSVLPYGDLFVTRFSATGQILWSTYLGGSSDEFGFVQLQSDGSGNVLAAGWTGSANYPTQNAVQPTFGGGGSPFSFYGDMFVTKLNANGQFVFSTYLGGSGTELGMPYADSSGNVLVVGMTDSTNYPLHNASQAIYGGGPHDLAITKLNASGQWIYSTYLGGSGEESGYGFGDPLSGSVYAVGSTTSANYPKLNPLQPAYGGGSNDLFLTKLTAAGALEYSTTLGGSGTENGALMFDGLGDLLLWGETTSANFPTLNAAQGTYGGSTDLFLVKIDEGGGPVCTYSIAGTNQSFSASGGDGSVDVSTSSGCAWTALSNDAWLTATPPAGGTGGGSAAFAVAANTSSSARTGTLTVATKTVRIIQSGLVCSYTVGFTNIVLGPAASTNLVTVTAGTGCAWTATETEAWIAITSGSSTGTGNGSVSYSVTSNVITSSRSGTITVAGKTVTITQTGSGCTYTLASLSAPAPASGTNGSFTVFADTGCAWTATSNATWLAITSGASGSGTGTVSYTVAANLTASSRNGTITAGGQPFTINQAAGAGGGPLTVTSFKAKVNFAAANGDSGSLKATLALPGDFTTASKIVTLDAGGAAVTFTLDAKGKGTSGSSSITLANKKGVWSLSAKLAGGTWADDWLDEGFVNADVSTASVTMPVSLTTSAGVYAGSRTLTYKAKAGKSGSAK